VEEIPEMMKQIQEMRQSLVEAEQIEVLQQQIHSLNVTIKEKNCLLSDLDWQLTTKDYTINLLQKDRERQGVAVGGSTPMDIPRSSGSLGMKGSGPIDNAHSKLMSPTSLLTASDEYQHVRSYPSRPQSAGGSTQKPFLMGNIRNRSNSACRPVIQRGENFSIVMPTENENEAEEVLNLEESFDDRQGKILLGPSVETDDERHPLQKRIPPPAHTHHKREEEITEETSILAQQLKRFGRHRRGASHDSFLSTYSSTSSLQNILFPEYPLQPTPKGGGDGREQPIQRPLMKSLSPSHEDHVTQHANDDSIFKMEREVIGVIGGDLEKVPRTIHPISMPQNSLSESPKASTLKRRPPVNGKSGSRGNNNGYSSLGRNLTGVMLGGDSHKPFPLSDDGGGNSLKFVEERSGPRNASVSSSENDFGMIVSPPSLEPQVERNQSFASHGGESSPNSQMSEVPLSGHPPLPYRLPPAQPFCSSSDEEDYKEITKSGARYQSRSLENLFDSGSHHLIRRSFRKEFPGYFGPSFGPYHKQTPSSDSDPHQRARTLGPHLRLPQLPSRTALDPEDIENDVLSVGSDDERVQQLVTHSLSSKATIGRVRSASTGSLMIIYQSESSVEDLKALQD
jgi:hypothetical protein